MRKIFALAFVLSASTALGTTLAEAGTNNECRYVGSELRGGCSGFQYRYGLADTVEPDDIVTAQGEVRLVVDPVSLDLIEGSEVDFVESLGGSAFRITNPQAASGCGCGASFSV